jgi:uncharacterized membrane protein
MPAEPIFLYHKPAMLRLFLLITFFLLLGSAAEGQVDSIQGSDTVRRQTPLPRRAPPKPRRQPAMASPAIRDSVSSTPDSINTIFPDSLGIMAVDSNFVPLPVIIAMRFDNLLHNKHPFYQFKNPVRRMESLRVRTDGKEPLFYSVVGLLLFFALLRNGFSRYLQDLFRLFFRSSLKQRQAKEQLMEAYAPSLLLNLLFVVSGALFLNLILKSYKLGLNFPFWTLSLYAASGLAAIYFVKFIVLKIIGWIFRIVDATDTYTFIVFTTNKVIGIALLPFIILLAFTTGTTYQVALTLSLLVVGGLFLYRYFLSYTSVQRQVRLNLLHFLLYLVAFELLPLLLINKLLFQFLG